jgi:xanthine dehydrogenase YagT iron-sulfur-binding subunit
MANLPKSPGPASGHTRRDFLKGTGAGAAATALANVPVTAEGQQAGTVVVRGWTMISLDVNGQSHQVKVEPRTTLLEVLRYQLDLTGAKPVSLDGSSGASTVLVDGKPVMASTTLALAARGKKIKTVEGLGGKDPDPVARAFVEHDAEQCGFCTPGFVVAVRAFLDKNPQATDEEIRGGLNGNICRCGTYANVIRAACSIVKGGGNG